MLLPEQIWDPLALAKPIPLPGANAAAALAASHSFGYQFDASLLISAVA